MEPWPCITLGDVRLPRLVFLHGFLGRGADWQEVAAHFTDRYCCILPDLPGHGANTHLALGPALDYERLARGLARTLAESGKEPVVLVGYSLGGRIGLYAGLQHPGMLRGLLLESTNPGLSELETRQQRALADERQAQKIQSQGMDAFLDDWYAQPLFRSLHARPALLERMRRSRQGNQPVWMAKVLRELSPGSQPFLGERWNELNIPVLLLAGSLDEKYAALVSQTAARFPRVRGLVVPQAGHSIHAERPGRFRQILRTYLAVLEKL